MVLSVQQLFTSNLLQTTGLISSPAAHCSPRAMGRSSEQCEQLNRYSRKVLTHTYPYHTGQHCLCMDIAHPNFLEALCWLLKVRENHSSLIQRLLLKKMLTLNKSRKPILIAGMEYNELPRLLREQYVWIKGRQASGTVVTPRSYVICNQEGEFRRNRRHLVTHPPEEMTSMNVEPESESMPQSLADTPHIQSETETADSSHVCTRSGSFETWTFWSYMELNWTKLN